MRKTQNKVLILLLSVLVVSCATTKLTPGGNQVKVMKSDPDPKCVELGQISEWKDCSFMSSESCMESAKNLMKNRAAEKGANFVRLEQIQGTVHSGTAYKCP